MKKLLLLALVLGFSALVGCATPTPTAVPKKSGTIRVGFSSDADLGDVPTLMALDVLRSEGYTVQPTFFATADVEVAALAKGDLDIGNGSTRTIWSADAQGAAILTVAEEASDDWSLVARNDLKNCTDLDNQRVGITSTGSLNAALLRAYIQENCPTAKPQLILISNSSARATALLANQLDATNLELADVMEVQKQAPENFHTLVNFAQTLPQLKTTGVHVRQQFAAEHPEQVRDYLKALVETNRQIAINPKGAQDTAVQVLKMDPADAQANVASYVKSNIWDVNGGMTRDAIAYSVDFFTKSGAIPAGLTADKVSDLSYLDAVLNEIGRK
jgi:ABC-type nitrate/sulfonate/bicarbonate transport system substrate-binding protein